MYKNVHNSSSITDNSSKSEIYQISSNSRMYKQWQVYRVKYTSMRMNQLLLHKTTWMNLKYTVKPKKPDTKEQTHMIPFIKSFKIGKTKLWSGQKLSPGQKKQRGWEGISGVLGTFYFLIQVLVIQMYLYCKNLYTYNLCIFLCQYYFNKSLKNLGVAFKNNNLAQ